MRETQLTAAGIDIQLKDRGDVVLLRAVEIATAIAELGDGADKEDVAQAIDEIMRFDVAVTPLQLSEEDVEAGLHRMEAQR